MVRVLLNRGEETFKEIDELVNRLPDELSLKTRLLQMERELKTAKQRQAQLEAELEKAKYKIEEQGEMLRGAKPPPTIGKRRRDPSDDDYDSSGLDSDDDDDDDDDR